MLNPSDLNPGQDLSRRLEVADFARAAAVFLLVFSIYFVSYSRTLPSAADEMVDFGLTQSLAKWQIFSIDQVSTVGPNPEEFGPGDHRYSKYGPLQAVLAVPLFWVAQRLPIGAVDTVLLLNHLVTALAMALLFLLVRRLGYGPVVALGIVALVAFGTPVWVHAKRYFGEPTMMLCIIASVTAAYVAVSTRRPIWLVLTGLTFGAAVAAKYVNAVLLLPIPIYLAWSAAQEWKRPVRYRSEAISGAWATRQSSGMQTSYSPPSEGEGEALSPVSHPQAQAVVLASFPGPSEKQERFPMVWRLTQAVITLFWFGVGLAPVAVLLFLYNYVRFGDPLATGYAHWETFSTPMWVGVAGMLFSPGKSLFVYTPLFLLVPFWGLGFVRRFPAFAAMVGALIVFHLCLYGAWWVWWGAWTWGPRFIAPILPLIALFLAEGFAGLKVRSQSLGRALLPVLVALLGLLSFAVQIVGVSVDYTTYLVQLLPLNPKPDTLTLYDLRYQPILHQIPLMTRQWFDFAWIVRTGPSVINATALTAVLVGVGITMACFVVVWLSGRVRVMLPVLVVGSAVVVLTTYSALYSYGQTIDPTTAAVVTAIQKAPPDTAILQLLPDHVIPYDNWQKRSLPELGWIEEPNPNPIIVQRLQQFEASYPRLWVLTQTPPKVPSNGIEAMLDRSLVQVGDDPVGSFRLLQYVTRPANVRFVGPTWQFADGIELDGFALTGGPLRPGRTVDLTLRWRASKEVISRPDYTVFVHIVSDDGKLVAQHDDPPASGYASTSSWRPGQVVYDDHAIAIPNDAATGLHLVQVGLYLPSNGKRVPLVDSSGKPDGDSVTLDLAANALMDP